MATRFISGGFSGGGSSLDVPVAALAGLSVAFVSFAAPADILAELVGSTGLASVFPAAEPPIGLQARLGIGAAGAVLVFALAFALLRWLDRFGRRPRPLVEPEPELEQPRLRRRDFHPDAAPRPPLFAGRELGEPEAAETIELDVPFGPAPEAQADPALPSRLPEDCKSFVEEAAPVHAKTVAAPAPAARQSLAELLERLEQGLARRRVEPEAPEPEAAAREAVPEPFRESSTRRDAADDRLQSAIDSLQRLASRHD